jgi:DNA polymerase-3 subunit epsilon
MMMLHLYRETFIVGLGHKTDKRNLQDPKRKRRRVIDLKNTLERGRFYAFDVEGDGRKDQRPVEISFCLFESGKFIREHYYKLNPGRSIGEYAERVHGISDADVKDCPTFEDVEGEIREIMTEAVLVGHDCFQDMTIISRHLPEALLLPEAIADTYRMAKKFDGGGQNGSLRLGEIASRHGIAPENAPQSLARRSLHSSSLDAWMTGATAIHFSAGIENSWQARQDSFQRFVHRLQPKLIAELQAIVDNKVSAAQGMKF